MTLTSSHPPTTTATARSGGRTSGQRSTPLVVVGSTLDEMKPRQAARVRTHAHSTASHLRPEAGLLSLFAVIMFALYGCAGKEADRRTESAASRSGSSTTPSAPEVSPPLVGQRVDVGEGGSIAVHALQLNVPGVKSVRPSAGSRFVAVDAEGCTGPKEVGLSFAPDYFKLELPGQGSVAPAADVKRPAFVASVLSFGQCARGWITYEVPRATSPRSVVYEGAQTMRWVIPQR